MVTVRFLNLLRSKYHIEQIEVKSGSIHQIIKQILKSHPDIKLEDFNHAAFFVNDVKITHLSLDQEFIADGETLIITHFVGGG